MRKACLILCLILALFLIACERPRIGGTLTVQVANFSDRIPQALFEQGLSWIQQELAGQTGGVQVVLVPKPAERSRLSSYGILLEQGEHLRTRVDEEAQQIRVTIPPNYRAEDPAWREELLKELRSNL